jgi:hypothetical protein
VVSVLTVSGTAAWVTAVSSSSCSILTAMLAVVIWKEKRIGMRNCYRFVYFQLNNAVNEFTVYWYMTPCIFVLQSEEITIPSSIFYPVFGRRYFRG